MSKPDEIPALSYILEPACKCYTFAVVGGHDGQQVKILTSAPRVLYSPLPSSPIFR